MGRIDDMKELIRGEIQNIGNLQERVAFKELMEQVFLSLYETNEEMYRQLEKRIEDDLAYDVNRYLVKTGIIQRSYFDDSHHLMAPMDEGDREAGSYVMKDIVEAIESEGAFCVMKVMLQCDFLQLREIWEKELRFRGEIITQQPEKTWEIEVTLRRNTAYVEKVAHLYQLFLKNGIPWQTVNAPYLYKMADVALTALPEGISGNEKITKIQIDFEQYNQIIRHDLVPIWNIKRLVLDGMGFPVPCEDHKNYEHAVSIREHGMEHAYLAEDDQEIRSISQQKDRLLIISESGEAKKWNVYMIRNAGDGRIDHYDYPILRNQREETFSEKFQRKWDQNIRTRAELARFIKGFGLEAYIVYERCEILEQFRGRTQTYSMNPFIEDEIRDTKAQKKLMLYFKAGAREPWLQRDIASFIVSEVQRLYPEYECGGTVL